MALLIFVPSGIVSQALGFAYNVPAYRIGLPQWDFSVTASTCFLKAPGWSIYSPRCYFLNYQQLLALSIVTLFIGYYLKNS